MKTFTIPRDQPISLIHEKLVDYAKELQQEGDCSLVEAMGMIGAAIWAANGKAEIVSVLAYAIVTSIGWTEG